MKITKMHGLGNDFILTEEYAEDYAAIAKRLCRRRLDVGADGLIAVAHSDIADVRMRIFNADGSEAEMCGNGIRCFARYLYERGIIRQEEMAVETLAGVIKPQLMIEHGQVTGVRVDMGVPDYTPENIPVLADDPLGYSMETEDGTVELASTLVGVPHAVVFDHVPDEDVARLGCKIETDKLFPRKTNVNFARVIDEGTVRVRTWERGVGRTLACGTGCSAVAAIAHKKGLTGPKVRVLLEAGELLIEDMPDGRVFMTGPAEYVFTGETAFD